MTDARHSYDLHRSTPMAMLPTTCTCSSTPSMAVNGTSYQMRTIFSVHLVHTQTPSALLKNKVSLHSSHFEFSLSCHSEPQMSRRSLHFSPHCHPRCSLLIPSCNRAELPLLLRSEGSLAEWPGGPQTQVQSQQKKTAPTTRRSPRRSFSPISSSKDNAA